MVRGSHDNVSKRRGGVWGWWRAVLGRGEKKYSGVRVVSTKAGLRISFVKV